jgi:hypothetical protein
VHAIALKRLEHGVDVRVVPRDELGGELRAVVAEAQQEANGVANLHRRGVARRHLRTQIGVQALHQHGALLLDALERRERVILFENRRTLLIVLHSLSERLELDALLQTLRQFHKKVKLHRKKKKKKKKKPHKKQPNFRYLSALSSDYYCYLLQKSMHSIELQQRVALGLELRVDAIRSHANGGHARLERRHFVSR